MSWAAEEQPQKYDRFNDFFTRAVKSELRPIAGGADTIISPVDGVVSQFGILRDGALVQAKGKQFTLQQLFTRQLADYFTAFAKGKFATLYLSPKNYHRVHMPLRGELLATGYVPGRLFAVNNAAVTNIKNLYARNERLISIFATPCGLMAVVLVGAFLVGGIDTSWEGQVGAACNKVGDTRRYQSNSVDLQRAAELGRFKFGSTVILLFQADALQWSSSLQEGSGIKMGQELGVINS